MAALQERNGSFRVIFRYGGRQHSFTAGKVSHREADLIASGVDRVLLRLEQGLLSLPPGADLIEFVRHDGKPPVAAVTNSVTNAEEPITLGVLRDRYLATHAGSLEAN